MPLATFDDVEGIDDAKFEIMELVDAIQMVNTHVGCKGTDGAPVGGPARNGKYTDSSSHSRYSGSSIVVLFGIGLCGALLSQLRVLLSSCVSCSSLMLWMSSSLVYA